MGTGLLTSTGFDPKRLADVVVDLEALFRAAYGQSIPLGPDTIEGNLIGAFAIEISEVWELAEAVYVGQIPSSASDTSLDGVSETTGVVRNSATKSTVTLYVWGAVATIPTDSEVAVALTGDSFKTLVDITLPAAHTLTDMTGGANTITRAGTVITVAYVAHGFLINEYINIEGADQVDYNGIFQVVSVPTADTFTLATAATPTSPATGTVTGNEAFSLAAESADTGPIQALAGTLTDIVTPISGWEGVTNAIDAAIGTNEESNAELRVRRLAALQGLGNATVKAIRGDILQVANVLSVTVFENPTGFYVGTRPPYSIECLVDGGVDADIGTAIFESKAAGIEAFGTSSTVVVDTQGFNHTISFTRPTDVNIWVDVVLTTDTDFPTDGYTLVEQAILDYGDALLIGEDVITPYLIGAIVTVPGIVTVVIDIGTTASPSGDANVVIAETDRAKFDSTRTTVV